MDNEDKNWIKENEPELTTEPETIYIDSYYKGFHVGFKKNVTSKLIDQVPTISKFIDQLIKDGFKASWNEQTNKEAMSEDKPIVAPPVAPQHYCSEHSIEFHKFEKNGQVWYSHKQGEEWHNER